MDKPVTLILIIVLCLAAGSAAWMLEKPGSGDVQKDDILSGISTGVQTPTGIQNSSVSELNPRCNVTITQTDGSPVTVPCNPGRIIVANANAAEMLIALGASDRIVGISDSTRSVPYLADKLTNAEDIGNWQTPNVEQILSLHPDIVISYSSYKPKNLDKFMQSNITIVYLDCYRLSTLASDARALGRLTGNMNEAEVYSRMVEDIIATVNSRVKTIPAEQYPEVYFESYTDFTAAAKGSGADEMLTLAGGKNIAGDISASSAKVSAEWVVSRQPDYLMKVVSSSNTRSFPEIVASLKAREGWNTLSAVQKNQIYALSNDIQYGPRAYIGLVWIAQLLHPKDFQDLHPRNMLIDYNNRYVEGTNTTMVIYP